MTRRQFSTAADRDSGRLNEALWLVLRRYARQIKRRPMIALPALVLPGIGDVLFFYAPPLVVAPLLGAVARGEAFTLGMFTPYVLTFTALWLAGEAVWRGAEALIARAEIRGIASLYIEAMDELLAKDLAFFHNSFAGSLTKRTLGYARRFEDVFDVVAFQVIAKIADLSQSSLREAIAYVPQDPATTARSRTTFPSRDRAPPTTRSAGPRCWRTPRSSFSRCRRLRHAGG